MRFKKKLVALALLTGALLLGPIGSAQAIDRVWSGQFSSDWAGAFIVTNWFNPNNALDNGIPDADDVAIFNQANAQRFDVFVDPDREVESLEFVGDRFSLSGAPLTLIEGNITTSGSNNVGSAFPFTNVIRNDLVLNEDGAWNLGSNLGVARVLGERSLVKQGAGSLSFFGQLTAGASSRLNQLFIQTGEVVVSDMQLTVNRLTGSGSLFIQAGGTFVVASSQDSSFSGSLFTGSGTNTLIKQGIGTLTLSGDNQGFGPSGVIRLDAGKIVATNNNSLGFARVLETGGTSTLEYQDDVTLNNQIDTLAIRLQVPSGNATHSGLIMGSGSVTKTGAGTLTLTGGNFYAGGTTISGGRLVVDTDSLPASGGVLNNSDLEFAQSFDGTYTGAISGSGRLIKTGVGMLTLTANNSYSGGTTVASGRLRVSTGSLPLSGGVVADSGLEFNQSSDGTYAGDITGTGALFKTGAGRLTLTGSNTYGAFTSIVEGTLQVAANNLPPGGFVANNAELEFAQATTGLFSGTIGGGSGGSVTKSGAGQLTLTGDNTYEGTTLVEEGILVVSAPAGSATGSGQVTVTGGSGFGGSGLSGGKTLVEAGALRPNLLPGQLVLGELELQSGSSLLFEIGMEVASDLLVNGTADLGGVLAVELMPDSLPDVSDEFTLLTAGDLIGVFANVADGGRLETLGGEGSFEVSYDGTTDRVVLSNFAELPGDYNADGIVNAADYTVWRDNVGAAAGTLANDLDGGTIGSAQYDTWRDNFGAVNDGSLGATATSNAVPEPSAACLLLGSALAGNRRRRR